MVVDFASLIIIGAIVSMIVQAIKVYAGTDSTKTIFCVVAVSLIAGTLYYLVKDTPLWYSVISILGFAGAVYTFIIKRFEN